MSRYRLSFAVLRDTTDPLELFSRHARADADYGLVISIAGERSACWRGRAAARPQVCQLLPVGSRIWWTNGISPSTIMAMTFTTAAAATLRQRLTGVLGWATQELTITTFHALGLRLIKQWAQELGFSHIPAVYGREDARALLRQAATGLGLEIAPENSGARRESLGHVDRETCRFARPVSARNLCRHSSNHQGAGHRR
jgi:hypothetical protein